MDLLVSAFRQEPYNRLQAAASTLSNGPVAPSDKIGGSDAALILRSCAGDGKLLQPDRPATKLDAHSLTRKGTGCVSRGNAGTGAIVS